MPDCIGTNETPQSFNWGKKEESKKERVEVLT